MTRLRIDINTIRCQSTFAATGGVDDGCFDGVIGGTVATALHYGIQTRPIPSLRLKATEYFACYIPEVERLDITRDIDVEMDVAVYGSTSSTTGDGTAQYELYMAGYVQEIQRSANRSNAELGSLVNPQPINTIASTAVGSNQYKHRLGIAPNRVHRISMRIPANTMKAQSSACRVQFMPVFPSATYIIGGMSAKCHVMSLAISGEKLTQWGWVTL